MACNGSGTPERQKDSLGESPCEGCPPPLQKERYDDCVVRTHAPKGNPLGMLSSRCQRIAGERLNHSAKSPSSCVGDLRACFATR